MIPRSRLSIFLSMFVVFLFISGCGENFDPSSYSISGKVTGTGGGGVEGVNILFSGDFNGKTTTAADGSWQASRLKGTVTVTPSMPGCTFDQSSRPVTGAATDVNFIVMGFTDDFFDAGSGWEIGNESDYSFAYDSGEYRMLVNKSLTLFSSPSPIPVSAKYSIQADMRLTGSYTAKLGLFFYGGDDFIYGFRIDPGGQKYQIFKLTSNNYFTYYPDGTEWIDGRDILKPNITDTNKLRVEQDNSQVKLYINGNSVPGITVVAHNLSSSFYEVGLLVGSYENQTPVTGHFDNFQLSSEVLSGSVVGKTLLNERTPVKVRVFREE